MYVLATHFIALSLSYREKASGQKDGITYQTMQLMDDRQGVYLGTTRGVADRSLSD